MKKFLLSTIALVAYLMSAHAQVSEPKNTPQLEFALQLKVTLGEAYSCGETQHGQRTIIPITGGTFEGPEMEGGSAVLTGMAPVSEMRGYQMELTAYTHGQGRLSCMVDGYAPCHNAQEVIAAAAYDPDADLDNPSGSVFCSHGAGFVVDWSVADAYMHIGDRSIYGSDGEWEEDAEEEEFLPPVGMPSEGIDFKDRFHDEDELTFPCDNGFYSILTKALWRVFACPYISIIRFKLNLCNFVTTFVCYRSKCCISTGINPLRRLILIVQIS